MQVADRRDAIECQCLLLPVAERVGARQKTAALIAEMEHPNTDWNAVVAGIRAYLFDHIQEIGPWADQILPVLFTCLERATARKKITGLRACETFFDRYLYVLRGLSSGTTGLASLKPHFDRFALRYLDLMIRLGDEGLYFGSVLGRLLAQADFMVKWEYNDPAILGRMVRFILGQYRIYVRQSIRTNDDEIEHLLHELSGTALSEELRGLLQSVSTAAYDDRCRSLAAAAQGDPASCLNDYCTLIDTTHNTRIWEKVCLAAKRAIEEGVLVDDEAVLALLSYLIRKSNEGEDRELQLFMSRAIAAVLVVFAGNGNAPLLRRVLALLLPVLVAEVEQGGNQYAAFATMYHIGRTVIESGMEAVIEYFVDVLVKMKFCFPEYAGIADDWSVTVNMSHLENIRTWMKLIELSPLAMRKLAASLIVNLKLGGVFLKDTDVFQRDISRLLNSDYRDAFYLITALAAVFPAFYHDIGATGDIRSFTETIDTNHQMNDLVHFLRKQIHVESSSRTVLLMRRIMEFWMTGDRTRLMGMVPAEVYDSLEGYARLITLADRDAARRVVDAARSRWPALAGAAFWDFLDGVDAEAFLAWASTANIAGLWERDRQEILELMRRYFETRTLTEMPAILRAIAESDEAAGAAADRGKFFYEVPAAELDRLLAAAADTGVSRVNIAKCATFLHVFRMIYDKYTFSDVRSLEKLEAYAREELFAPPPGLFDTLRGGDDIEALQSLLSCQRSLKEDILLSGEVYEAVDTIEFKRHIAFGIPSMYGSYKERKFDTLKVFFHLNMIRVRLFERIIEEVNLHTAGPVDYAMIRRIIQLFYQTIIIDGLANHELTTVVSLLETPNCTLAQLRDIVNHLLGIHGEIADRFNETFRYACRESIRSIGIDRVAERYVPRGREPNIDVIMDRFMRDQIMQSPILQLFDTMLVRLRDFLIGEIDRRGDAVCLNARDHRDKGGIVTVIAGVPAVAEGAPYAPVWEVGGKAHGLLFAASLPGLRVPPGFVISSEIHKRLGDENLANPRLKRKILGLLRKGVDGFTGGRFANPRDPLLLSVRSGAVFSMPGVMDTITNVGITQQIIDHYADRDPWFAYDCYRRLIQDFGISAYGMDRSIFENIMARAKEEAGVPLKEKLTGRQMEHLTRKYRYAINDHGHSIPKDPYEQLLEAIIAVYRSWNSDVARMYREYINLSDGWGTAVIVQHMVFGNRSPNFITGVAYSMNGDSGELGLFGEYKTRAQGHDIVSGVATVFPISEAHKRIHAKSARFPSLEAENPRLYRTVYDTIRRIRDRWGNDVEVEFTVEQQDLYILQIRGMLKHIFEIEELVESPAELQSSLLGQGLAASGGAVSGRAVFDIGRIDALRAACGGDKIILVRPETNPEDVVGLKKSDGILTSVGGMTSHAVLQMRRLEKSGVSDFSAMRVDEVKNCAVLAGDHIPGGTLTIREGDRITIDGSTGNVYSGFHRTRRRPR